MMYRIEVKVEVQHKAKKEALITEGEEPFPLVYLDCLF